MSPCVALLAGLVCLIPGEPPLSCPRALFGPTKVGIRVPLYFAKPPPAAGRAAIIIDDLGHDLAALGRLWDLRLPLTLAVLPAQPWSERTARGAAQRGFQVMVHLPMEPVDYPAREPGPGAIMVGMSRDEVARVFDSALGDVPGAVGFNNHMGSRVTRSRPLMREVLGQARRHGLFFIDSRTTSRSVGYRLARAMGVPAARRTVFLDSEPSRRFALRQLRRLEEVAREEGGAIGIGHPFPETLEAIRERAPEMARHGIELVYVDRLVE